MKPSRATDGGEYRPLLPHPSSSHRTRWKIQRIEESLLAHGRGHTSAPLRYPTLLVNGFSPSFCTAAASMLPASLALYGTERISTFTPPSPSSTLRAPTTLPLPSWVTKSSAPGISAPSEV